MRSEGLSVRCVPSLVLMLLLCSVLVLLLCSMLVLLLNLRALVVVLVVAVELSTIRQTT